MNLATTQLRPLGGELITFPTVKYARFQIFPKIGHGWTFEVEVSLRLPICRSKPLQVDQAGLLIF